jgi:hypothetical protein
LDYHAFMPLSLAVTDETTAGDRVAGELVLPSAVVTLRELIRLRINHPDAEGQFAKAIKAFRRNGFLVLVDDRQITDLDETLHLTPDTRVAFVRLVPLAGG